MTEEAVIREHGEHVRAFARSLGYYLPGAEIEDLEQEALIGLLSAARSYRPERGPFLPFALGCVRLQLIAAVRSGNKKGALPLNTAARVGVGEDGTELPLVELVEDPRGDTPTLIAAKEKLRRALDGMALLPLTQRRAVVGTALGFRYDTFGPRKSVDNALQLGLRKLRPAA